MIERIRRAASPCLRRQLAAAGVDAAAFRAEDVARLPLLDARALDLDVVDDPVAELRLADAPPPVRLGTVERNGRIVVVTWTARDLAREATSGARQLARAGIEPGMKVANTLEGGFTTPGSLILGDALEALGALDVPLGPARDTRAARSLLDLVDRVGVEALVLGRDVSAGMLELLREKMPSHVRGVLWCAADPLPDGLPVWTRRWLSIPEVAVFAAVDCPEGRLHPDVDLSVDAIEGRLVVSALDGDAPVVRYDSGLAGSVVRGPCACGAELEILLGETPECETPEFDR